MTLIERWSQSMMDNYGTPPLALVRGEGAVLIWDNRTVQHRGVFNYADQHRSLLRAVID